MILPLTVLLSFQLAGEAITRGLGLAVPGPVLGLMLLLAALAASPRLTALVQPLAQGLLAHLSLLFVPAGVGIVGHLDRLGSQGAAILAAIVVSTALAMTAAALAFTVVARATGAGDD